MSFDKKPANWKTVKQDGTCEVQISEGGAFRIIDENKRQLFCLPIRNLGTVMALLSGITHEELVSYENEVAKTKEAVKITKQLTASVAKAQKLAQAAKEQLVASGMTPEQAESFLQGKAG